MMRVRNVATGFLAVLAVAIASGLYVFFNPSQEAPRRETPSAGALPADDRAGYYLQDDGEVRLVLPGVYSGYRLYHTDSLHAEDYAVQRAVAHGDAPSEGRGALEFSAQAYTLRKADGTRIRAAKIRPQPFSIRDVTVRQGGVTLAAWLFTPRRPGGVAAVIVHGSGRSDRDNAWYVRLAARLARAGAFVVLPDKRGAGRSQGHWWHADFHDLADDAAGWLEFLRGEVGASVRTGYVGVSQGGRIAPIAAARHGRTDFVAILSTAATRLNEQLRHEIEADARAQGAPGWLARLLAPAFAKRVRNRRPAWWDKVGNTDPIAEWRAADTRLFISYGMEDEEDNVPVARSVARIEAAFGGNPNVALHVYENVGHGYIVEPRHIILPQFLRDLAAWLGLDAQAASTGYAPPD